MQAVSTDEWTLLDSEKQVDTFASWLTAYEAEESRKLAECSGVKVVFVTEWTPEMKLATSKCIPHGSAGAGLNDAMACNGCRNAVNVFLQYRDVNGEPLFMSGEISSYPEIFHPLWHAARTGTIERMIVADSREFGLRETDGWNHFSIKGEGMPEKQTKTVSPMYESHAKILHKYMILLHHVFEKNAVPGIHASMDALIAALSNVLYGGKLLESALWFRKHVREDYNSLSSMEKMMNRATALFELKHSFEVGSMDVTLPLYHQLTKNTLDALECCDDIKALTGLLKERLSPYNYQVKTAAATDGQVEMAMKHIGEFSVKVMTLESAFAHGATKVEHDSGSSSSSAFLMMKSEKGEGKGKGNKSAAGFAVRANADLSKISTMKDLMDNMPRNLEVQTSDMIGVYANDFVGLKDGVYQTPFTWGFQNGRPVSDVGLKGWHKVLAVLPMKGNFLFICEGAIMPTMMSVCCHVGLLTPEYNKSCGQAFGNLGKNMVLDMSPPGPHAIGVGVSLNPKKLDDPNPPLGSSIRLRSGTSEFVVR